MGIQSAWEGSQILQRGSKRSIAGSNPTATNPISEAVPTNALWIIPSTYFTFVTDATGTPRVDVTIDDGTNTFFRNKSQSTQDASATWLYTLSPFVADRLVQNDNVTMNIPYIAIPEAYRLRVTADSIGGTDDFTAPRLYVYECVIVK